MMAGVQDPARPVHHPAVRGIGERLHADHGGEEEEDAERPGHARSV
jgi:hypothetical protein